MNRRGRLSRSNFFGLLLILLLAGTTRFVRAADHLDKIKASGVLRYGTDAEGGAPLNSNSPRPSPPNLA
jgi:hypothetical protein